MSTWMDDRVDDLVVVGDLVDKFAHLIVVVEILLNCSFGMNFVLRVC
jgi:hypothetical protein